MTSFYGREYWGTGEPENLPFEGAISSIIEQGGLILDVGCGLYKIHPDCLGVDAYTDDPKVNVQAYMWDMPFEENSVDSLFCFHALEHISKYQVLPVLDEFQRVLKPNHTMLLLVPDLEWVLSNFLASPTVQWDMDMIFGKQTHDNITIHEGEFHKTGFTKNILSQYIAQLESLEVVEFFRVHAYNQYNLGVLVRKNKGGG